MNHNISRSTVLGCYLGMLLMMQSTAAAANTIAIVLNMFCCYCFSNFMDLNNMCKNEILMHAFAELQRTLFLAH